MAEGGLTTAPPRAVARLGVEPPRPRAGDLTRPGRGVSGPGTQPYPAGKGAAAGREPAIAIPEMPPGAVGPKPEDARDGTPEARAAQLSPDHAGEIRQTGRRPTAHGRQHRPWHGDDNEKGRREAPLVRFLPLWLNDRTRRRAGRASAA